MDPKYKHVIESFGEIPAGEEVPLADIDKEEKARRAALHWYSPQRYRSSRQFLPPFLQFPFPLNLVRQLYHLISLTYLTRLQKILYLCIPFLIPAGLTYAAIRFRRESSASRRRLQALLDSPEAQSSLSAIMQKMEIAIADVIDSADPGVAEGWDGQTLVVDGESDQGIRKRKSTAEASAQSLLTPPAELDRKLESQSSSLKPNSDDPLQPMLTPAQRTMARSLNSLPQLRKVRAYFPYVRNAHSVIIVRDPKMFPIHLDGMGVVQHWVDRFVL